jgi:sarcosine oxidase subunit beta
MTNRTRSADVIVIGAGIIGLSTAYHLAQREPSLRIIVLECEGEAGTGSTAKATGGIRHQFGSEVNIRLTQLSYPDFLHFPEEHAQEIGFRANGYLFVASSPEIWRTLQASCVLQNRLGVPTRLIGPSEVQALFPEMRVDDLLGGAFCSLDATANPSDVLQGYLSSSRARGVDVVLNAPVTDIESRRGHVTGVRTVETSYTADVVVNAAGPRVAQVGAFAGVDIPAKAYRRQVFVMKHDPRVHPGLPFTVDLDTGWYVHQDGGGRLLFGGTDKDNRPGLDPTVDWAGFDRVATAALMRVPPIAERAQVMSAYAGIRTLTPDHHAIIGRVPQMAGFFVASACNGHGFMHAPAVGKLLAEEILDGSARSLDITSFSLARFDASAHTGEPTTF